MKILALADRECPYLWDYLDRRRLEGVDLILSCGDLDPSYLSFLATFAHAPVLYVHGNHDDCYQTAPPEGCICVEDRVFTWKGVRVLGLGGSMRYKQSGEHQYTQRQIWTEGCCAGIWSCCGRGASTSCSPTLLPWG